SASGSRRRSRGSTSASASPGRSWRGRTSPSGRRPRSSPRSGSAWSSTKPCAPSWSRASAGSMMAAGSASGVIVRLDTVDSTQTVAFALAERGAADRTVVIADQQSSGRGRRGRVWQAPARSSLLASILVRPRLPQGLLATLSPMTAVVTAEALRRVAPLAPRLKWPNDVLVNGRKIAGILLESRSVASSEPVLVIGVGVNLGQREFPPELAGRATSVALET